MGYVDEVKTCENLAEEFFDELEGLVYGGLLKDMTHHYRALDKIRDLIKEYKPKMVS